MTDLKAQSIEIKTCAHNLDSTETLGHEQSSSQISQGTIVSERDHWTGLSTCDEGPNNESNESNEINKKDRLARKNFLSLKAPSPLAESICIATGITLGIFLALSIPGLVPQQSINGVLLFFSLSWSFMIGLMSLIWQVRLSHLQNLTAARELPTFSLNIFKEVPPEFIFASGVLIWEIACLNWTVGSYSNLPVIIPLMIIILMGVDVIWRLTSKVSQFLSNFGMGEGLFEDTLASVAIGTEILTTPILSLSILFFPLLILLPFQVITIILFLTPALKIPLYAWLSQKQSDRLERIKDDLELEEMQNVCAYPEITAIRYEPYFSFLNWLQQRRLVRSGWKRLLVFLLLLGLVALLVLNPAALSNSLNHIYSILLFPPTNESPCLSDPITSTGGGLLFLQMLSAMLFFSLALCAIRFVIRPQRILLDPLGFTFDSKDRDINRQLRIHWNSITNITLRHETHLFRSSSNELVLERGLVAPVIINLSAISSEQDREELLKAFEKYASHAKRSPEVIQVLQSNIENSYTDLWLQALAAPPKREGFKPLIPGVKLNDGAYEVLGQLGCGGQGFAYIARETKDSKNPNDRKEKLITLKEFVLPMYVDINARKQAMERFEKEARLLAKLDHEQIVKLAGFFVEDHRAYLALEHIEGESLRQVISGNGSMAEERVREMAIKMAKILEYLHEQKPPIVHRDFTPDNLILDKEGNLKLIDFNVAQQIETCTTGTVVGKQAYIAPEQFRGRATSASDIYSMGATLYYLLTGKDPVAISQSSPKSEGLPVSDEFCALIEEMTELEESARPSANHIADIISHKQFR